MTGATEPAVVMSVDGLNVEFGPVARPVRAVADASLVVRAGEILGVVGESGSGKTTLCSALVRAAHPSARVSGRVTFDGAALYELPPSKLRALRGRELSMILQNPMTSLDPLFTIGAQVGEVLRTYGEDAGSSAVTDLLRRLRLTAPDMRARQFPHQMSGGMKQRILTGMATASTPRLLVADEPTTALDVTIQEEILVLFRQICDEAGTAILIVTHDLDVVRRICDRVVVMYAGRIVEAGPIEEVFERPRHPYTAAMLGSLPTVQGDEVVMRAVPGQVPPLDALGPGCAFADRCDRALERCAVEPPPLRHPGRAHEAWCWQVEDAQ